MFISSCIMMNFRHIGIVIIVCILSWPGQIKSSNPEYGFPYAKIDSLRYVIESDEVNDSLRMDAFRLLGWEIRRKDPSEALKYTERALTYAEKIDCPVCKGTLLANIGHLYWRMGNFSKSYEYLLEAMQIVNQIDDVRSYARILNHLGILFSGQGYYDQALEHYLQALELYEELDSVAIVARVLNNIGVVYLHQDDYEQAEEFFLRSFEINEVLDDDRHVAFSLNNLGTVYKQKGELDRALTYLERARDIREENEDLRELAITIRTIGYLKFKKGQHYEAIDILSEAKNLYLQVEDQRSMARLLRDLGEIYTAINQYQRAEDYFRRSLQKSEYLGLPLLSHKTYLHLSELMARQQNYEQAYIYQEKYLELRDSTQDEESRRRVIEMQMMYDRERQASEIELLTKSNEIAELSLEKQRLFQQFLIVVIVLILLILVAIYYRFREAKRINRLLESQKEEIVDSNNRLKDLNNSLIEEKRKVDELNKRLRESESHLREANKTKDKFFSIISHDLRNPFASIVSFSRILKRDIQDLSKEELQELARELDKSVIKISSLLENLLQWSRTQTGKINYQPEYFELDSVISETVKLFSGAAREKNVEIVDKTAKYTVYGDMNMTETIVRNLLSNALKYSYPGGKVEIAARRDNGMLEVSVKDEGVGIPEADQEKIFRVDNLFSTYGTRDEKGSGLGLLLCKEFTRHQGGDIYLKSEEGMGSEFSFTIPLKPPAGS